jgi:hypothetical protein
LKIPCAADYFSREDYCKILRRVIDYSKYLGAVENENFFILLATKFAAATMVEYIRFKTNNK